MNDINNKEIKEDALSILESWMQQALVVKDMKRYNTLQLIKQMLLFTKTNEN